MLLSTIKKTKALIIQKKSKETIELEITKPREKMSINIPLVIHENRWTIGLTSLEVYKTDFKTNENDKIYMYIDKMSRII